MKIRTFKKLQNGVFDVRIQTEDWSENDRLLMIRHGEPEINFGGTFVRNDATGSSSASSGGSPTSASSDPSFEIRIPDAYARVMTESPFTYRFDSRDCGSVADARAIAQQWISAIEERIITAVTELRAKSDSFTTEEITEI